VSHIDVVREDAYMLFYVRHPKLAVREFYSLESMIVFVLECSIILW